MAENDAITGTARELSNLMAARGVFGEPLEIGNKTLIPVFRFGCAFGAGDGKEQDAGGAGFGIDPVAVIILHRDVSGAEGVQVMSLKKGSAVAEVISSFAEALAPQVIDAARDFAGKERKGGRSPVPAQDTGSI